MLAHRIGHLVADLITDEESWDGRPIKYCQSKKIDTGLLSDMPAVVAMQWVPDGGRRKKKTSKDDLATIRQTFQKDLQEMRVSWSGVRKVANDQNRWKRLVTQCSSRSGRIVLSHQSTQMSVV